jgi:hypothetical protein
MLGLLGFVGSCLSLLLLCGIVLFISGITNSEGESNFCSLADKVYEQIAINGEQWVLDFPSSYATGLIPSKQFSVAGRSGQFFFRADYHLLDNGKPLFLLQRLQVGQTHYRALRAISIFLLA